MNYLIEDVAMDYLLAHKVESAVEIFQEYPHIFWTLDIRFNQLSIGGRLICEQFPLPNHSDYWLHSSERYVNRQFGQILVIDLSLIPSFMSPACRLKEVCSEIADNLVEEAKKLVRNISEGRLPS